MYDFQKRPKNDRNVEEMRNNEEEWNNNMIAAYLNTNGETEYKHDFQCCMPCRGQKRRKKTHS